MLSKALQSTRICLVDTTFHSGAQERYLSPIQVLNSPLNQPLFFFNLPFEPHPILFKERGSKSWFSHAPFSQLHLSFTPLFSDPCCSRGSKVEIIKCL